jgi:hypothetical protein
MAHETATPPARFGDYLKEMKESVVVLRWIWDELLNKAGKRYLVRMLVAMILSVAFFAIQPLIFAQIIIHERRYSLPLSEYSPSRCL